MEAIEPVRFEDGRPMLLGGLRRRHAYAAEAQDGIARQWQDFQALGPLPGQRGDLAYGVLCGHDAGGFEYMVGAEVAALDALPPRMGRMRIAAQHYAVFLHRGPVSTLRESWMRAFEEWLPRSAWQSAQRPDFERYDARFDPATGEGEVELWVAVLPRERVA